MTLFIENSRPPLLILCRWLAKTHIAIFMRDSTYAFAIVEMGHLLALAIFGGAILLVNLRFLNLAFRMQPASQVAQELLPLTAGGVVATFISGLFLFLGGAVRYYHNPAFRLKIVLFLIALLFHFILQIRTAREAPVQGNTSLWLKVSAVVSLLLWFTIGLAGRAVGYV
jgi:hypothetical protein